MQQTFTWPNSLSDGPVFPGPAASSSTLIGGQFSIVLPTLTDGQQSAVQLDSNGRLIISPLTVVSAFDNAVNTIVTLIPLTPTLILAANPNRKFANFSNSSGSLVSIQLANSTGLNSTQIGIPIATSTYYELKGDNLYRGPVYAFTYSSNIQLSVVEGTL